MTRTHTHTHTFEVHSFLLASVESLFWISICTLKNTITKINKHMQSLLAGWWLPVKLPSSDDASSSFHASSWNSIKQNGKEIRFQFEYMLATNSVYFLLPSAEWQHFMLKEGIKFPFKVRFSNTVSSQLTSYNLKYI